MSTRPHELHVHTGISLEPHSRVPTLDSTAAAEIITEIAFTEQFDLLLEDRPFDLIIRARHEAAGYG